MRKILVLNSGSSTIKYRLFDMSDRRSLLNGLVERIGLADGYIRQQAGGKGDVGRSRPVEDHRHAVEYIVEALGEAGIELDGLDAIGHRVVHGGERFWAPARLDDDTMDAIHATSHLAPLHNPPALLGIDLMRQTAPQVPQFAVFDTAFHHSLPPVAHRYAIPDALYRDEGVRRYGFHGTSHKYVAARAAEHLGQPLQDLRLITLHLGNGASAAAIRHGESVDTSMGMTPMEGLVMGGRSGDLDPGILLYLLRDRDYTADEVDQLLNRQSGLLGVCGASDMQEVLRRAAEGDAAAALAVDIFCYRIRKYIGAYLAILGGLDTLVFTGGIGEHSHEIRARCCEGLGHLGITIDAGRNSRGESRISGDNAAVAVLRISTNEELEIANQVAAMLD